MLEIGQAQNVAQPDAHELGLVIATQPQVLVGVFQAVTQIQEQSLTFVPKMVIIFGSLAIMGPWLGSMLLRFTELCFEGFPNVVY